MGFFTFTLIYAVLFAIICAVVASSRGRDPGRWFVLGAILGILGLLILALLPPLDADGKTAAEGRRKCPFCAEWVRREAVVCRFCGKDIPAEAGAMKTRNTPPPPRPGDRMPKRAHAPPAPAPAPATQPSAPPSPAREDPDVQRIRALVAKNQAEGK